MAYHVYILRCADGNLYIGCARDLDARVRAHNAGRGPTYTFQRRPVQVVYSEVVKSEVEAVRRERQLKRWSRGKKEALIAGDVRRLKQLSQSHS
jgi:predicted GIY-YIG superfamily endonuclease